MRNVFVKSNELLVNDNNPHVCMLFMGDSWHVGIISVDGAEDYVYFTDVETHETVKVIDA